MLAPDAYDFMKIMIFRQRQVLLVILVLMIGAGAACKRNSGVTSAPPAGTVASPAAPETYHQSDSAPVIPQTKFFKGSIGTRLGLQMKLTREGDRVTGSYSYQKVGGRIDLKGTIDRDGNLSLEEFDSAGQQSGLFKGSWLINKDDGLINLAGNWSKPNSDKRTSFSLHEEPIEFSGGVELTAKQIKENNKKLHYQISADYPQATGGLDNRFDKFNQEARSVVGRQISEFKKQMSVEAQSDESAPPATPQAEASPSSESTLDISYDIALANDEMISLRFAVGTFSTGAAHPNSSSTVLNYDVKAGKALKLADLFNPGAKYLQSLASYCIKDLKQQVKSKGAFLDDATIESGAAAQAKNYQSWTITRKGLEITFDAYQVGPYAAGPQYVLIPYASLKDIIKSDGPLARFLK